MASLRYSAIATILVGVLYQWWLREILSVTFGVGREVDRIEDFRYKCKNLEHEQLGGCSDMWLDERTRVLFAACAGVAGRQEWNPRYEFALESIDV